MVERLTQKVLLAVACCFALIVVPASAGWAQNILKDTKHGIQKGAEAVKKGTETVVDKTKEGAEYVGKGAKDLVTDSDKNDRQKMTPGTTQSTSSSSGMTTSKTTSSQSKKGITHSTGHRRLPRTAGELPLLALAGVSALAIGGTLRMRRKVKAQ